MQLLKKLLGQNTLSRGIVAISFVQQGIAIAIAKYADEDQLRLCHCEFIAAENQQTQLPKLIETYSLNEFDCHLLLTTNQYRTINIEKPAVETQEMKEAVRWKINDLIDFPADQAGIDFFALPAAKQSGATGMLCVIASPLEPLKQLLQQCLKTNLNVKVIDIQETTLRNLSTLLPENDRGIALLHLQQDSGMIIIEKDGVIYLSRKLDSGFQQLELADNFENLDSQSSTHLHNLALEIQRSLDYVESYYGLPPISGVAIIPMARNTQKLLDFLNSNQGITARIMDISATMDMDILLDDETQSLCSPAIGATLRYAVESA